MKQPVKPYTELEIDYLRRVAGKVPIEAISKQLNRSRENVYYFCSQKKISLRVPAWRMQKYWPEIIASRKKVRAS